MGAELGRISGPLLSANLLRNGYDLAFESTLLYLNVTTGRIGINSDAPTKDLFVNDTIRTDNLIVSTEYTTPNFIVSSNTIQQTTGILYVRPDQTSNPTINAVALGTSNLRFDNNELSSITNINFSPSGTGKTNFRNDVYIDGSLTASGNITWDGGTITLGNSDTDNVEFGADVNSNIIPNNPDDIELYTLGNADKRWSVLNTDIVSATEINSDHVNTTTLYAGNIRLTSNTITNVSTGEPINLTPTGSGLVNFNSTNYILGSSIMNQTDSPLNMAVTGLGYYKFNSNTGVVIPTGPTVGPEGAEIGMIRYNTELGYVRVFDGTNWISAIGTSSSLSIEETTDIIDIWTLILG